MDYACSQAVTHPTTNTATCCLTSEINEDAPDQKLDTVEVFHISYTVDADDQISGGFPIQIKVIDHVNIFLLL